MTEAEVMRHSVPAQTHFAQATNIVAKRFSSVVSLDIRHSRIKALEFELTDWWVVRDDVKTQWVSFSKHKYIKPVCNHFHAENMSHHLNCSTFMTNFKTDLNV